MELVRYLSTLKQGQTTLAEINHNRNCEEKSFEYADNRICDVNFPLKQSTTLLGASTNKKSFAAYASSIVLAFNKVSWKRVHRKCSLPPRKFNQP